MGVPGPTAPADRPAGPTGTPDAAATAALSTLVEGDAPDATAGRIGRGQAIDRYVVLDRVGSGGMGVVYAAYDPDLDRKVAVKVLHRVGTGEAAQAVARARMLREAQSLAKLSHPNVVTIHDVGTFAERAWIAMEFVDGRTLSEWSRAEVRPPTAVLDVMLAVGDGVAAAHAAGILHRDLKPDNIMVGDDGRVRVMDFGLARGRASESTPEPGTAAISNSALFELDVTRAGALIGTPAYMAPEQLAGAAATPVSDQFSYCVTLWEALYGARPFGGDTVHQQLATMLDSPPRPGPRRVPAWLRRIVARGLARQPAARHADIGGLLAALRSGQQRAQRRTLASVGLGVAVLGLGAWGIERWREQTALEQCALDATAIATQWPGRRDELDGALARSGLVFAVATAERLPPWLDAFAAQWTDAARTTCVAAHRDPIGGGALGSHAGACLDTHAVSLEALLDSLATGTPTAVRGAVRAAANLPDPTDCTDALATGELPWSGAADGRRVAELRARITRADATAALAHVTEALAMDDGIVAESVALGWPPLVAEAKLARARHLSEDDRLAEAEAALRETYFAAMRSGSDRIASLAAMWLVRTVGRRLGRHDEGILWGEHARAVLERRGHVDPLDRAALDSQIAGVERDRGNPEASRRLEEGALALREAAMGPDHPDVADSLDGLGNALYLLGEVSAAKEAYTRALAIHEQVFGPVHPVVADTLNNLANVALEEDRPEEAEPLLLRAIAIGEATFDTDTTDLAVVLASLGSVYMGMGRYAEARALYERGLAMEVAVLGPEHHEVGGSHANLGGALLQLGDAAAAATHFERAAAIVGARLDAMHPVRGRIQFNLALARIELGEFAAAETALARAIEVLAGATGDGRRSGVQARLARAMVLRQLGRLDEAQRELDLALASAELVDDGGSSRMDAMYERGELFLARGNIDAALATFAEAAGPPEKDEPPATLSVARLRLAAVIAHVLRDGATADAEQAAARALSEFEKLGARPPEIEGARRRLADAVALPHTPRRRTR